MTFGKASNKRALIIIASLIALILVGTIVTIAYNISKSGTVDNEFTYATVSCEVKQVQSAQTAEHIRVVNTSDTAVYIRAFFVVNYVSLEDPNRVFGIVPVEGNDYVLTLGSSWIKGSDGFYYYTSAVEKGGTTDDLVESVIPILSAPDGYRITVTTVASAIQALPYSAAEEAWGVTINDSGVITGR